MSLLPILHRPPRVILKPLHPLPNAPPRPDAAAPRLRPSSRCRRPCCRAPRANDGAGQLDSGGRRSHRGPLPRGRAEVAPQAAMALLEVSSATCSSRGASARRRGPSGVYGHRRHTTTPALLHAAESVDPRPVVSCGVVATRTAGDRRKAS